ncbi:MAG TPA: cytochrome c [Holophagaceae bacterium]|jgi:mono/diheme cytochrome c family protein|nr:cytochrome c [Holophagaceae bacterium]
MRRVFPLVVMIFASAGLSARPAFEDAKDLKGLYNRSCAVCHGEDGSGRGPNGQKLGGRDLANPRWQARTRDSQMVNAILKGKESMPAFGAQMSEADALKLVTEVIRPMAAKKH